MFRLLMAILFLFVCSFGANANAAGGLFAPRNRLDVSGGGVNIRARGIQGVRAAQAFAAPAVGVNVGFRRAQFVAPSGFIAPLGVGYGVGYGNVGVGFGCH